MRRELFAFARAALLTTARPFRRFLIELSSLIRRRTKCAARINEFFVDGAATLCLLRVMKKYDARPIDERDFEIKNLGTNVERFEPSLEIEYELKPQGSSIRDAVIEDLYDDHYLGSVRSERG